METLGLNPSSTTSCLRDIGFVASVSLRLHVWGVGRMMPALLSAVAGLILTAFSPAALCFLSERSSTPLCLGGPGYTITPALTADVKP